MKKEEVNFENRNEEHF
ncbi:Putative uncharacterized protein [Lactococcus lactis subsp. lactis A12]|uniref:Uncharacterized protein n=1 Tax=Lactococcus lactis subsp. lactis A12 TaxID=1137134 RepID=S6ERJ2_LACLL|nr:Putative uncharacterized protein [Lactococcus lactis subsp. lactis A12]